MHSMQVMRWITKMKREGTAFFTSKIYLLGGACMALQSRKISQTSFSGS